METKNKKLPVGIEMFRDIREHDFYYIDKTGFIKELLESWTEVNLFTRPRRFGKSLNMDMLKAFFVSFVLSLNSPASSSSSYSSSFTGKK